MTHCFKPCKDCPFLENAGNVYLDKNRRREIHEGIIHDGDFPCHKTVDYSRSDKGRITSETKICKGSALYLQKNFRGGLLCNVQYRLRVAFGEWKLKDVEAANLEEIPTVEEWLND